MYKFTFYFYQMNFTLYQWDTRLLHFIEIAQYSIHIFSDSDFAEDQDRKSTAGAR